MPVVAGTQYAEIADLTALGLLGNALSGVSADVKNAALSAASGFIDSYIIARHSLPLDSWGTDLVRATSIIAAYDLLTSRGFGQVAGPDEHVRRRYEDVIRWLEAIRDGELDLTNTDDDTSSGSTTGDAPYVVTSSVRGWTSRGCPGDRGTTPIVWGGRFYW